MSIYRNTQHVKLGLIPGVSGLSSWSKVLLNEWILLSLSSVCSRIKASAQTFASWLVTAVVLMTR